MKKIKKFLLNFTFVRDLRLIIFKFKWKKKNKNNFTEPVNMFPLNIATVGKYTYGPLFIKSFGNPNESISIGNYCSIAEEVKFLLGGEHNYNTISTYPFKVKLFNEKNESISKGKIIVEDDVWIGYNSIILSGVKIGQGAVIGANSIVTKDVPPYSIWVGNKVIKKRFDDKIIEKLEKINFEKLEIKKEKLSVLYENINENNIDKILSQLNK